MMVLMMVMIVWWWWLGDNDGMMEWGSICFTSSLSFTSKPDSMISCTLSKAPYCVAFTMSKLLVSWLEIVQKQFWPRKLGITLVENNRNWFLPKKFRIACLLDLLFGFWSWRSCVHLATENQWWYADRFPGTISTNFCCTFNDYVHLCWMQNTPLHHLSHVFTWLA